MAIDIDKLKAGEVLKASHQRVIACAQKTCAISEAIDFVMNGKDCLTYKYILFTALLAKATDPRIDILSLQVEDSSAGAYAPRTLCQKVVYPFQKHLLGNALDGSNPDPLVNKPARYPRIAKTNAARGDGAKALTYLYDALPTITTQDAAREALDYLVSKLVQIAAENEKKKKDVERFVTRTDLKDVYDFLVDLLDQGFGGLALVLVVYALFLIHFPCSAGYRVIPHPVNQSGKSSRQKSDLDVELNKKPFLGVELKDKPFNSGDVSKSAEAAFSNGLQKLLFISGRHTGNPLPASYFAEVKQKYAKRNITVGVITVDALIDFVLTSHPSTDVSPSKLLSSIYDCISQIGGTVEAQTWVYDRLSSLG